MKSLLTIALSLVVVMAARAQQINDAIPLSSAYYTISTNFVLTASTNTTLTAKLTIQTDGALYHTFQFYAAGSNFSYSIDRSSDNTNWFIGATNVVTTTLVAESTITAKEKFMRVRFQGTNYSGGVNYLGGR
jgi:hypothetical protein